MKNKFFKDLKAGLEDAIAYENGKLDLRSELVEIPEPPTEHRPKQTKKIREN
jgi:putative transcriptional regulator